MRLREIRLFPEGGSINPSGGSSQIPKRVFPIQQCFLQRAF
jgi:hypothetical protein